MLNIVLNRRKRASIFIVLATICMSSRSFLITAFQPGHYSQITSKSHYQNLVKTCLTTESGISDLSNTKRCNFEVVDGHHISDSLKFEKSFFTIPKHYEKYLDSIMIPNGMIQNRIEQLSNELLLQYENQELHLLCVLKGASVFFGDLLNSLMKVQERSNLPIEYDFIKVKSYEGSESSGSVQITGFNQFEKLTGKHILIVEDIIDTGLTMSKLVPYLYNKTNPASIKVLTLLEKRTIKPSLYKGDFIGFSIPNEFIVGYGLDYNEKFRDMRHIAILNQDGIDYGKAFH
jgi:hypoxanthine phosphoribosyltransferase